MISDKQLSEQLYDGELANISLTFWMQHAPVRGPMPPDHPVWAELKAFQAGWVACKEFYSINN